MAFTSKKQAVKLIPDGEYESIVNSCNIGETMNGTPVLKFDFSIRSDVEQECGGRHIYKNFYPDDGTGEWPQEKIGAYASALGIEDGVDFEPWELNNRKCIVVVRSYEKQDGEQKNCIFYLKPTVVSQDEAFETADALPTFDDEEIPFK